MAFFYADQHLAQFFAGVEFQGFRHFSREVTDLAEGSFYLLAAAAVYFSTRSWLPHLRAIKKNPYILWNVRRAAGFALSSLITFGIVIHVLKFAVGRQRPHLSPLFEADHFSPFNFHWHWHSFPSGHAQVIFTVATLISLLWPRFRIALLTFAFAIAVTRVVLQQHFLSDVLIGAMIGYLGPIWLFQLYWQQRLPVTDSASDTGWDSHPRPDDRPRYPLP